MLAILVGRDLWGASETALTRGEFRMNCRKAFDDIKRANGIFAWRVEVRGAGRKKMHRYHYEHALAQRAIAQKASDNVVELATGKPTNEANDRILPLSAGIG